MNANNLQEMTVKALREYIKQEGFEVVGAWKMKKEDLIDNIIFHRETRQMQLAMNRMRQEEAQAIAQQMEYLELEEQFQIEVENEIVAQQKEETIIEINDESRKTRKNKNTFVVILEDDTKLMFDSNKDFAEYFNTKHDTNFRSDIAWYIARNRNKKAKQIFEIKEII